MTDPPMLDGGHYDLLLARLPTDPAEVTDEHMLMVADALGGEVRLLDRQREDILFIARVNELREPVFLTRVVEGCRRERGVSAVGEARLLFWAWRVAYHRYPGLYDVL